MPTSRGAGIVSCPAGAPVTGTNSSCAGLAGCAAVCATSGAPSVKTNRIRTTNRFMSILSGEIECVELLATLLELRAERQDDDAKQREGGDAEPERAAQP